VAIIKKTKEITNASEDVEKGELSYTTVGMEMKMATMENSMEVPPKLEKGLGRKRGWAAAQK
jgi:hypothetical protein